MFTVAHIEHAGTSQWADDVAISGLARALGKFIFVHSPDFDRMLVYPPEKIGDGQLFVACQVLARSQKRLMFEEIWDAKSIVVQFGDGHYWPTFLNEQGMEAALQRARCVRNWEIVKWDEWKSRRPSRVGMGLTVATGR